MDLTPSDEQEAIRNAAVDWLTDKLPIDKVRRRDPAVWRGLGDMGWLCMTVDAIGLDHATEALVYAELGRFLAPVAAISTAVAARWIGTEGKTGLAIAGGEVLRVIDGDGAATAIGLVGGMATYCALPLGLASGPGIDPTTTIAIITPASARQAIDDPRAALHLQLLAAAYAVGVADCARDMAANYARIREQFERPIGWFQGVKHPCADMAVRCAVARSQLYFAACALDVQSSDAGFHIAAAKRLADDAALLNGRMNIQIHGGIGMTDDAYPHLTLKRAHLLSFIAPVSTDDLLSPELEHA